MGIIKSKIFIYNGLLIQEYSDELNKEDMLVYFTGLYCDPEYLNVTTIFSDFTYASIVLSFKDLSEIAAYILKHAPKVQYISNAILVSKPITTAYSMIYETLMKVMPLYECKIFSTFKEAANFIRHDPKMLEILTKTSFNS